MQHISSRQNPLYKQIRRLAQGMPVPVGDDQAGSRTASRKIQILLEGIHLCQDWLRHRGQPRRAVFDAERLQGDPELQEIASRVNPRQAVSMPPALMRALSVIGQAQGVLFVADHDMPVPPPRIAHACIWLDRIQDPGNVGTLLRTAAAAGIGHAYLSSQCAAAWSPRVLRSAQGAHFSMVIYEQVDLQQAGRQLDVPLYATALARDSASLYEVEIPARCAWLFGNEGQGIAPELLAMADQCVHIPQDERVESLNVGVAAGICLFEQRRRHIKDIKDG